MYDYLIVGAGLYGAVMAHELTAQGRSCLVIDKRDHIGGNIYTSCRDGIHVHEYGAHIFHTSDREVWDYICRFSEFNNYVNSPMAVYHDEIYNLPFNMNTFAKMWGIKTPQEAKDIIDSQIADLNIGEPANLEEQALKLVGRDVYEKLVKGYTEKQWGRECKDLPAFIIRRLPMRFTYDNNYFNDRYQGIPIGGYTAIVERLLEGSDVRLKTDYFELRREYLAENIAEDRGEIEVLCEAAGCGLAKEVIYTGMIDEYFGYIYGPLEYRSVRFETDRLEQSNYQGCAVVNYTASDVPYTRIIEHKHFEKADSEVTYISREYPMTWEPGMEPYYPVNDERNSQLYAKYAQLAKRMPKIRFGGRLGSYRYYDMDKVIRAALDDLKQL